MTGNKSRQEQERETEGRTVVLHLCYAVSVGIKITLLSFITRE